MRWRRVVVEIFVKVSEVLLLFPSSYFLGWDLFGTCLGDFRLARGRHLNGCIAVYTLTLSETDG